MLLRIGGDGDQGLGAGLEQDAVDHRLVLVGDVGDCRRQGEHDEEVRHVQQLGLALCQPLLGGCPLIPGRAGLGAAAEERLHAVPVELSHYQDSGEPAGLLAYRELDDVLGLTDLGGAALSDLRRGKNVPIRTPVPFDSRMCYRLPLVRGAIREISDKTARGIHGCKTL